MSSALAARISGPVQEQRRPIVRFLTAATDVDILVQMVLGLTLVVR
jgi:hypothetical protein